MRNLLIRYCLIFFGIFFGCASEVSAQNLTVIKGIIKDAGNIKINLDFDEDIELKKAVEYSIETEGDTFRIELPQFNRIAYISMLIQAKPSIRFSFYLIEPYDSIYISVNNQSVEFSGRGAEKWKFKFAEDSIRSNVLVNRGSEKLETYFKFLDARTQSSLNHLELYKSKVNSLAYQVLRSDLIGHSEYKKMQNLLISIRHEGLNSQIKNLYKNYIFQTPFKLSPSDTSISSLMYLHYLHDKSIIDAMLAQGLARKDLVEVFDLIKKQYKGIVQQKLLAFFLIAGISLHTGDEQLEKCINTYLLDPNQKNINYKALVQEMYLFKKSLAKGKEAYNFNLANGNGEYVSLSDFKGKLVYIDFWASWCKPCRAEFKDAAPALKQKFKDRSDIVFLYISMDASQIDWKRAIQQDNIQGIHLISDKAMEGELAKKYLISALPRYMIIDKSGLILEENAERPSSNTIYSTLIGYLGQ